MTPKERQALREKHVPCTCGACYDEGPECVWCAEMDYPCDVIKLLDATENLKSSDLKDEVECDHLKGGEIHEWERNVWVWFTYCPKCGEKL